MRRVPLPFRAPGLLLLPALAGWIASPLPAPAALAPAGEETAPGHSKHLSSPTVKRELTTVIEAQLAAFRAGDYAKAYTFAAAEIQGIFPLADFEVMVKRGFPVIANSTGALFGLAFDTGEDAVVNVRVENAEGAAIDYQYLLKKEGGGWRIGGVTELKKEGLSV